MWINLHKMHRFQVYHCVKIARIWSYSGSHFPAFELNNFEYGHFLRSVYDYIRLSDYTYDIYNWAKVFQFQIESWTEWDWNPQPLADSKHWAIWPNDEMYLMVHRIKWTGGLSHRRSIAVAEFESHSQLTFYFPSTSTLVELVLGYCLHQPSYQFSEFIL